jgi:hypothetical protein
MACMGCKRRARRLLAAVGQMMGHVGRPIPRRVLDVTVGVQCRTCGFTADGVCFAWDEHRAQGYCAKCRSYDLSPGSARL